MNYFLLLGFFIRMSKHFKGKKFYLVYLHNGLGIGRTAFLGLRFFY